MVHESVQQAQNADLNLIQAIILKLYLDWRRIGDDYIQEG
jgi:hypothetical protein